MKAIHKPQRTKARAEASRTAVMRIGPRPAASTTVIPGPASGVSVAGIASIARGQLRNARLINFGHFEYPAVLNSEFHPAVLSHDVMHFRVGSSLDVMEIDLSHGDDLAEVRRAILRYQSPKHGFMKNPMPSFNLDLQAVKALAAEAGAPFLKQHPNALRLYYLSPNLFNGYKGRVPDSFIVNDAGAYAGAVWAVAFVDVVSGAAFLSMFDTAQGRLLFSATQLLSINVMALLAFAFWGLTAKYLVLACCLIALVAAIAALVALIAAAPAVLGPATALGPSIVIISGGTIGAALAASAVSFWVLVGAAVGAIGSVIWILNCIITENAGAATAAWNAKWKALQAKINLAQARLSQASSEQELKSAWNELTSLLDDQKSLVNDPESGMTDEQKSEINENTGKLISQMGQVGTK